MNTGSGLREKVGGFSVWGSNGRNQSVFSAVPLSSNTAESRPKSEDSYGDVTTIPFNHIRSGDLLLMNRRCIAMKDIFAIGICSLSKTENSFDHAAMFIKMTPKEMQHLPETRKRVSEVSPSDTYVLETNVRGVTLYPAEGRIMRSGAREMALRPVQMSPKNATTVHKHLLQHMDRIFATPYRVSVTETLPLLASPPDKMARIDAATKVNQLQHEIDALQQMSTLNAKRRQVYGDLVHMYTRAQQFLVSTYFPHLLQPCSIDSKSASVNSTSVAAPGAHPGVPLPNHAPSSSFPLSLSSVNVSAIDWANGHFIIDGGNHESRMMCSELICNLWHRASLTTGFVPASSMRPFDFLQTENFNFVPPGTSLGPLISLRIKPGFQSSVPDSASARTELMQRASIDYHPLTEEARLRFLNEIRTQHHELPLPKLPESSSDHASRNGGDSATPFISLPTNWLLQSETYGYTLYNLPSRVLGCGVLFSLCHFLCAPLSLRAMEGQTGMLLQRGSVWSLASGLLVRNLTLAAVQCAVVAALIRGYVAPTVDAVMGPQQVTRGGVADTRHPYYTVVGCWTCSAVVAHMVTTPIHNATVARHFGPVRPGPLSRAALMRGAFSLAPLSVLVPLQFYWLGWYETVGSFIIPTRSSILRQRADLLELPSWPHMRRDALLGAMGATFAADLVVFASQHAVMRRMLNSLYMDPKSQGMGRRLLAGYRYRLAGNAIIAATTVGFFSAFSLL